LASSTIGHEIEPIAIPEILGHAMFVGRQDDLAFATRQPLDFDKP
jgi:hypothetical protein